MENDPNIEELRLVRQAKEGNIWAFSRLVDDNKDILLSLACSILKDAHLAEDVLQEALIKVFHSLGTFKGESSFRTWVFRIVINTSYNQLKKTQRYVKKKERVVYNEKGKNETGSILKSHEQKKYLLRAIRQLKPDEALVLRLYYLCELSVAEVEEATGFKPSKIKTDLYRGRKNLTVELKKMLGDEMYQLL